MLITLATPSISDAPEKYKLVKFLATPSIFNDISPLEIAVQLAIVVLTFAKVNVPALAEIELALAFTVPLEPT